MDRSRNVKFVVERLKPRTRVYAFFDGRSIDAYITPKIVELIKDPSTDNRTNSTPFVIGETVIGQTSGARFRVASPNSVLHIIHMMIVYYLHHMHLQLQF
ncbi:MAG: hypothetical protein CM15mV11_0590 [Caudoviricetes sp.]|nr:MAG: hypothetical protein CM15mV11_0590 [Caudoviricetes sp.]